MKMRRSLKSVLVGAVASVSLTVAVAAPTPARAVTYDQAAAAAKLAYEAYNFFSSDIHTLDEATTKIINAINQAKEEIIDHIDDIAAGDGQACADSALIKLSNLRNMSSNQRQAFASANTDCVALIKARLGSVTSKPAIDDLGFALNTVGPIALLSYSYAGWTDTSTLLSRLRSANGTVKSKLSPSCFPTYLTGDQEPGSVVEVILTCHSYHSPAHTGRTWTFSNRAFDYTVARREAMRDTSYNVAVAVLPLI
jgi:hypothetical protein